MTSTFTKDVIILKAEDEIRRLADALRIESEILTDARTTLAAIYDMPGTSHEVRHLISLSLHPKIP